MTHLKCLGYPYEHLIQQWIQYTVPIIFGLSVLGVILDLFFKAENRRRGRFSFILIILNLCIYQNQYLINKHWMDGVLIGTAALGLLAYGICYRKEIRLDWSEPDYRPAWWIGLVIIAIITGIKLIDLSTWPPFLKTYAAQTGRWGMRAVEGSWPRNLFQGRGFDLRGGGESPLMVPVLWLVMKIAGINIFSVRFTEVIGSTILLLIFWSWVRVSIPGIWSCLALIMFGLSPWHIAQSRMGTFFSISAAVAIGLLWSAQNAWLKKQFRTNLLWWGLLGLFAGSIGWCYAPMKVLYVFFLGVIPTIVILKGIKSKGWWAGPLVAICVFSVLMGLQLSSVQNPSSMFRSHFGPLATDNPVWRKTVDDKVEAGVQPVPVIAENVKRNAVHWMKKTFREHGLQSMYGASLVLSFAVAVLCIIFRWNLVLGLYYLIGLLPPLIVFPLHRRTLIIWPLIYVATILFLREIHITGSALFKKKSLKKIVPVIICICLILITFQNMHLLLKRWSIVYDHTYFGPPWRLTAMERAAELMPTHQVVFVNPWVHRDTIEITLYEENLKHGGDRLLFAGTGKQAGALRQYVAKDKPTAFFYFDLSNQAWLKDSIQAALPGGKLDEVRNTKGRYELLYSVYTLQ